MSARDAMPARQPTASMAAHAREISALRPNARLESDSPVFTDFDLCRSYLDQHSSQALGPRKSGGGGRTDDEQDTAQPAEVRWLDCGQIMDEPNPETQWVVDELLPVGSTVDISGPPGAGKTTLVALERSKFSTLRSRYTRPSSRATRAPTAST